MEEDLPPPPRREAPPKEAKAAKEPRIEKADSRQKPDAEPMSVDKEPPAKVRLALPGYSFLQCPVPSPPKVTRGMHTDVMKCGHLALQWSGRRVRKMHGACCGRHALLESTILASYHMQAQANGHADTPQTTRLHVGHLTRNVNEGHIKEIFSTFGTITSVEVSIDKVRPQTNI